MKIRLLVVCLMLAFGATAAGCGGDEKDGGGGGGGGGGASEVSMKGLAFEPADITVKAGDTVTWTNDEAVGHDVTKEGGPGPEFSSGDPGGMQEGDTFEQTFDMPGMIEYVCTVHSNMTGTVNVE
ncbi:MAG: cupredoxin domain-containing protein [Thermoleophilaceae bacterium]